ncbi:MAG: 16S rRNA (guanine(527)-N(7))-methyltransferase RsmG [Rhodobacterales bacterium 32-66-7]|nr:MAG: 16S rRNA (guanine(527)-N(7))-methyltransferase RsmG [Rhodobacterales bacterium 32-66-7]
MIVEGELRIGGRSVSRETLAALEVYEGLVRRWNPAINLISTASLVHIRNRHTVDSVQLMSLCPDGATRWADLGAGGGFPGLVIAILARRDHPALHVTLVESDARKATFLRQAAAELDLKVTVATNRIESLPPLEADVISARALAPLPMLMDHAHRHLRRDGVAIFPKGERYAAELAEARLRWRFSAAVHPSLTDPNAAILVIRNIEREAQS